MTTQSLSNGTKQIINILLGIVYGALISIAPLALLNHKHLSSFLNTLSWQMQLFILICLITAPIVYVQKHIFLEKMANRRKTMYSLAFLYLFLYITCAGLCQGLHLTTIALPAENEISGNLYFPSANSIVITSGLLLIAFSIILQVKAMSWFKPVFLTASNWNWLVFMVGISLLFNVWLPLVALPGVFVVLKWAAKWKFDTIIN